MKLNNKKIFQLIIQMVISELTILITFIILQYPLIKFSFLPPIIILFFSGFLNRKEDNKNYISRIQYFLSIMIELALFFIILIIVVLLIDYLHWGSFAIFLFSSYIAYFINKNVSFIPISFIITRCYISLSPKFLANNLIYYFLLVLILLNKPLLSVAIGIFLSANILFLFLKNQTLIMKALKLKINYIHK